MTTSAAEAGRSADPVTHGRILRIAGPIVLSNATVPLLGAVDVAVVGQMGLAAPIGAVGVGAVILATLYWVFGFLRMGTSGLAAQAHGAGDGPETGAVLIRAPDCRRGRRAGLHPVPSPAVRRGLRRRAGLGCCRNPCPVLPCDPHLGRTRHDHDLCRRGLADRHRAHARRLRGAGLEERPERASQHLVRARPRLGRAGSCGCHADRRMDGPCVRPLALPRCFRRGHPQRHSAHIRPRAADPHGTGEPGHHDPVRHPAAVLHQLHLSGRADGRCDAGRQSGADAVPRDHRLRTRRLRLFGRGAGRTGGRRAHSAPECGARQ